MLLYFSEQRYRATRGQTQPSGATVLSFSRGRTEKLGSLTFGFSCLTLGSLHCARTPQSIHPAAAGQRHSRTGFEREQAKVQKGRRPGCASVGCWHNTGRGCKILRERWFLPLFWRGAGAGRAPHSHCAVTCSRRGVPDRRCPAQSPLTPVMPPAMGARPRAWLGPSHVSSRRGAGPAEPRALPQTQSESGAARSAQARRAVSHNLSAPSLPGD